MQPADRIAPTALDQAIEAGLDWLYQRQDPEGFWVGNPGVQLLHGGGSGSWRCTSWGCATHPLVPGLVQAIRNEQREDGSWEIYHDAPTGDINSTVECYVALRATGGGPG